jgi:hypothetical protein
VSARVSQVGYVFIFFRRVSQVGYVLLLFRKVKVVAFIIRSVFLRST